MVTTHIQKFCQRTLIRRMLLLLQTGTSMQKVNVPPDMPEKVVVTNLTDLLCQPAVLQLSFASSPNPKNAYWLWVIKLAATAKAKRAVVASKGLSRDQNDGCLSPGSSNACSKLFVFCCCGGLSDAAICSSSKVA